MSMEGGQNFIPKPIEQQKESSLKKGLADVKEKIDSLLKKETMFTSFENCEKELDSIAVLRSVFRSKITVFKFAGR
jgi:hypothetical protein